MAEEELKPQTLAYAPPVRRKWWPILAASFWVLIAYGLLSLASGISIAFLGEALRLSDRWESMYFVVPVSLVIALTIMLLVSWRLKSRLVLLASLLACAIVLALGCSLTVLERFTRVY